MKKYVTLFIVIGSVTMLSLVGAQQNTEKGADIINLNHGGAMAEVTFPHRLHQEAIDDCTACHAVFPMTPGIIKEMIVSQQLRKQQVMNGTCLACHKNMAKSGEATGPVSCNQCHVRK